MKIEYFMLFGVVVSDLGINQSINNMIVWFLSFVNFIELVIYKNCFVRMLVFLHNFCDFTNILTFYFAISLILGLILLKNQKSTKLFCKNTDILTFFMHKY